METTPLRKIILVRSGGSNATVKGYFVDQFGAAVPLANGTTFQNTLTVTSTPSSLETLLGQALPKNATGFRGEVTVAGIIIGRMASSGIDPTPNSAFGDELITANSVVVLGSVPSSVRKFEPNIIGSGGRITGSGILHTGPCAITGFNIQCIVAGTIAIADAVAPAGTELFTLTGTTNSSRFEPWTNINMVNGIYATFTTFTGSITAVIGPSVT